MGFIMPINFSMEKLINLNFKSDFYEGRRILHTIDFSVCFFFDILFLRHEYDREEKRRDLMQILYSKIRR